MSTPPCDMQGLDSRSPAKSSKQLTFELFFPRPPYRGAQYRAARGKVGAGVLVAAAQLCTYTRGNVADMGRLRR